MTGMEQSLRYIEREIRFMVKDQFGNATYAKYADRVVEDACGIPNFCSTVLSSKKPMSAILRAIRGPRGDVIMRFFNVSLHDARIEMVMVLAEAIKLRIHRNRTSRDAHEYLMKLYKKAIKRTVKLITGSKNKESYKSMYRGLRDFAHMDDFDYDDDYDEDDDYFDDGTDFGDSEYADECLDAYRNGEIPPEMKRTIKPNEPRYSIGLGGNEEILKEIASIEAKIGRHLTDAELDELLCDDDDEADDIESDYPKTHVNTLSKDSDDMVESITNIIYERLLKKFADENDFQKISLTPATVPATHSTVVKQNPETLDEFIDRQGQLINSPEEKAVSKSLENKYSDDTHKKNESLEELVGMHNHLKNQLPVESGVTPIATVEVAESAEENEESDSLPPNESLGGKCDDGEMNMNDTIDKIVDPSEETASLEKLIAANTTNHEPSSEHQMIISDIIRDIEKIEQMNTLLNDKIENYITQIGQHVTSIFVTLRPSKSQSSLLTLCVSVRMTGDYEIIDTNRLSMIVFEHSKDIASKLGIDAGLIDTDFSIVDSSRLFDDELMTLNVSCKNFTTYFTHTLNLALCVMVLYVFNRINEMVDIRFIHSIEDERLSLYFFNKDGSGLSEEVYTIIATEMQVDGINNLIETEFELTNKVLNGIIYHFGNDSLNDDFSEELTTVLEHSAISDAIKKYSEETSQYIINALLNMNKSGKIEISSGLAYEDKTIVIDLINEILTSDELTSDEKKTIKDELSINGEYRMHLKDLISTISSNTDVTPYLAFKVMEPETESDEEEKSESTETATSNFGI